MIFFKRIISLLLLVLLVALPAAAQTMATYTWYPPVATDSSIPNTLVLLSNDATAFSEGYPQVDVYEDSDDDYIEGYSGYFDPDKYYEYKKSGGGGFVPAGVVASGTHYVNVVGSHSYWSGNFLNWATMSNVDFMRKALTGGKRADDSVGHTTLERANITTNVWVKEYSGADLTYLVPSAYADAVAAIDGIIKLRNTGTTVEVRDSADNIIAGPFNLEVEVCDNDHIDPADTPYIPMEDNCQYYPSVDEYKPQGLLHTYGNSMRFGMMTYTHNTKSTQLDNQGGVLRKQMGFVNTEWSETNGQQNQGLNDTMIRYIENYTEKEWDPLAEMYFDAIRYYMGDKGASGAFCGGGNFTADDGYPVYGCEANKDWGDDPIVDWCQKNNILILNDEYPSQDHDSILGSNFNPGYSVSPATGTNSLNIDVADLTDAVGDWEKGHNSDPWYVGNILGGITDGDCNAPKTVAELSTAHGICPSTDESTAATKGTFHLAGLAHYAMSNDLRSDFEGVQNVRTFAVAFRATAGATYKPPIPPMNPLWLAAKYGNYDDKSSDGNTPGWPDDGEWETAPGSSTPKGYFEASNSSELEEAIDNALNAILETTASSTSVSVLANSGQGEGNLVQAYYRPRYSDGDVTVDWVGFLQSLWIDSQGLVREDTNKNNALDLDSDRVVSYVEENGNTVVKVYDVTPNGVGGYDIVPPGVSVELENVSTIWDAGKVMAETQPGTRRIFTYIDKDQNGFVEERRADGAAFGAVLSSPVEDVFDDEGEVIQFDERNYRQLWPYLNVQSNTEGQGYLGRSQKIRVFNLINWTVGYEPTINLNRFVDRLNVTTRTRVLNSTDVFKLGDIIDSTPVTVAAPVENFHLIYGDESYQDFYDQYKNRETVVYVGANDGMMHAFTSWNFNKADLKYEKPTDILDIPIGGELWAYIPQNLLPHLKWIPRPDYEHVYYVDLQPRVFDARIFIDDSGDIINETKHPNGWGTILVGGFGIGGGSILVDDLFNDGSNWVDQTRTFKPSFFAIDITDPRHPELLWERTYDGLGMSSSYPTILRRGAIDEIGDWYLVFGSGPDAGDRSYSVPQYDGESLDPANVYVVDILTGDPYTNSADDYLFTTSEDNAFMSGPVSFDKDLDYNIDAAYFPSTRDNGSSSNHDWKGGVYKITVPLSGSIANSPLDTENSGSNPWQFHLLFDSPRPVIAAPSLSIDEQDNTWVYFGTGRMYTGEDDSNSDFGSSEAEYLFGVKDPFFNRSYYNPSSGIAYYNNYAESKTIVDVDTDPADLFDADDYLVTDTGKVYKYNGSTYDDFGYFDNNLIPEARKFDGWQRSLDVREDATSTLRAMRNLNKPAVIGGLSLFTTFMPTGNTCAFGGESELNILYYLTGTAYKREIAIGEGIEQIEIDGEVQDVVKDSISLGSGTTSSIGIHIGRQNETSSSTGSSEGDLVTGFVQQGTGKVVKLDFETAFKVRSGLRSWREK
ncbi:MAG: hypothetical protein C0615_07860 [Desulfuromonas sp.]|nr:MAG: hypothetical protein C0615_07860 [Desulfuromonas sp.]